MPTTINELDYLIEAHERELLDPLTAARGFQGLLEIDPHADRVAHAFAFLSLKANPTMSAPPWDLDIALLGQRWKEALS